MRIKCGVIVLSVVLLMASTAMAFDGQRKGFVLGGGLGLSPVGSWKSDIDVTPKFEDSGPGGAAHLIIGYAWDNHNMIVYEANAVGYESDAYGVDFTAGQGFSGASWYHYFGPMGKTPFIVLGIGAYMFNGEFDGFDHLDIEFSNDPGGGVLLGGGYEFSRHWQVGAYFGAGQTSEPGADYDHVHLSLLVSGVAF